jgi:hypothetical protein
VKEINLPSGASLSIGEVSFAEAKALYQSLLREARLIQYQGAQELPELFKQILCVGFSSTQVEQALWSCLPRCLYNGVKIDQKTFEPVATREDYLSICVEVMAEVCGPFGKSLFAELQRLSTMVESFLVAKS